LDFMQEQLRAISLSLKLVRISPQPTIPKSINESSIFFMVI
jgi:hypothetical protein